MKHFVTYRQLVEENLLPQSDLEDTMDGKQPIAEFLGTDIFSQLYFVDSEEFGSEVYEFAIEVPEEESSTPVPGYTEGSSSVVEMGGHTFIFTDQWGYGVLWTTRDGAEWLLQRIAELGFAV